MSLDDLFDTSATSSLTQNLPSPIDLTRLVPVFGYRPCPRSWNTSHASADRLCDLLAACLCCEVTTRSTKVGYLMYLGNSNDVLLVLILSCCEDESMLLA
jgi:hypothetical protein